MLASDGAGDRVFSGGSSRCAGIARTGAAADQTAERECRSRGISHVWSSCMLITSNLVLPSEGESALENLSVNRISLPIPNLRYQVIGFYEMFSA